MSPCPRWCEQTKNNRRKWKRSVGVRNTDLSGKFCRVRFAVGATYDIEDTETDMSSSCSTVRITTRFVRGLHAVSDCVSSVRSSNHESPYGSTIPVDAIPGAFFSRSSRAEFLGFSDDSNSSSSISVLLGGVLSSGRIAQRLFPQSYSQFAP